MTDVEYMLKCDQREKKSQGRGIYAKRGGSRSKACRLPSDNLSKKELNKMNGEIVSYNLKSKIEWSEFKKMPKDLAKEYLEFLYHNCKGRGIDIAEFFGIDNRLLNNYTKNHFPEMINKRGGSGKRTPSPEWLAFIKQFENPEEIVECEEEPVIEKPVKAEKPDIELTAVDGVLHFVGDPYMAFAKTVKILDDGKAYDITIMYKEVNYAD